MTPSAALQQLCTHPRAFLRTHPLRVAGAATSGVTSYYIYQKDFLGAVPGALPTRRPGRMLKTKRMHETEGFFINTITINQGAAHLFQAYTIPTVQSNQQVIHFYQLNAMTACNLMLTSALTGCSFIVNQGGAAGGIGCAHLQPSGETGTQLNNRLNGQHDVVFGRNNYTDSRTVTIVGVRRNQKWKVYAQKLDQLNKMSIRSVHRIYPPD